MNCLKWNRVRTGAGVAGLLVFLISVSAVWGQDSEPNPQQQSHPDIRAVRLSFVQGGVQLTQGNQIIADPAIVNTPLFEGTVVTTREDGQAELQFDDGSVARLSPNSALQIAVLRQENGSGKTEVLLTSGLGYFESPENAPNQMKVKFGESTVTTSGFTVYRLNLDNPPGEVAVFSGNARVEHGKLSLDVHGGQSLSLNATDPNQYNMAESIEPDSWDSWNADRDQDLNSQESAQTVATSNQPDSSNPAWGDLDANGNWYNVPGQGYVWSPYQAADASWDPYGCGNWVYTPQFGYVWVSCESWGYMPYTTGYWNYYDGFGWGWAPGYGHPWWSTGGWWCNVGNRPHRYEPPHRPGHGPAHPVEPIRRGGVWQSNPVIAVNRVPTVPTATPAHPVGRAATIAGSLVEPIRPIAPRAIFNHAGETATGRGRLVNGGSNVGGSTGYNPWANSPGTERTNTWSRPSPGSGSRPSAGGTYRAPSATPYSGGASRAPSASGGGSYRPQNSAPSSGGYRPSAPAPAPRAGGGGSAPRPSGGGGGGGGSHVSAAPHK